MTDLTIRRSIALAVVGFCAAGVFAWGSRGRLAPTLTVPISSNHPVVVAELFTSEGCSSCPPADDVLSRLVHEPQDGTVVLGLGEHVDYWDRLGWKDPFSSPSLSSRQSEYQGRVFQTGSIYTPQLVIDGQFEAVGSDVSAVREAVARAAQIPKADIEMTATSIDTGHLRVHVHLSLPTGIVLRERADLVVALTQDRLTSDVRRGENRGRTLAHSAVVRSLAALGSVEPAVRTFETDVIVPVASDWSLDDLRIIGLLQERESRRIVGAGSTQVYRHDRSGVSG